eukprot:TRINITY_DN4987_c0_g2_i4.p1 TRINITY_DN4987_c0_g2~~TRINITY_DN4987_c0_g2_i4.p1  ORF type:complete len:101 (+),score=27.52 TRINITY_DN4987_c0_g2_i4:250-552(+)
MKRVESLCDFFEASYHNAEKAMDFCLQFGIQVAQLNEIIDKYLMDRASQRNELIANIEADSNFSIAESTLQESPESCVLLKDYLPAESYVYTGSSQYVFI